MECSGSLAFNAELLGRRMSREKSIQRLLQMKQIRKLIEFPVVEHVECVGSLHGLIKYNQL